jgi:hypothetical protein
MTMNSMRRINLAVVCAVITGVAGAAVSAAQPQPAKQWFVLHQEQAKADRLEQYEGATRDFHALVAAHRAEVGHLGTTGVLVMSDEQHLYTYAAPISSFDDVAGVEAGFARLAAAEPARFAEIWRRGGDATEWMRDLVVVEDPALSYRAANRELQDAEARYWGIDVYFGLPGRDAEMEQLARDYAATFRAKGVRQSYRVLRVALGFETPMLIVVIPARDEADLAKANAESARLLGEEGAKLQRRALALTRRFERHGAWQRPDLSLAPAGPR